MPTTPDAIDYEGLPPLSPDEEATMQEEIDHQIEPYRTITAPEQLRVMRETLEHALRTNPEARQWIRVLARRPVVDRSGTQVRDSQTVPSQGKPKAQGRD